MSESYKELLVKKQKSPMGGVLRIVLTVLAVLFLLTGMGNLIFLIIGVLLGVAAYFVYLNTDLEYEYLYLDKELCIDKIMAKTRRKRVASYDIDKLEIMAPINSHRMDAYNNSTRSLKTCDYTSGNKDTLANCYAMVLEGTTKVIIEADRDFVKAIYNNAPRKVFID